MKINFGFIIIGFIIGIIFNYNILPKKTGDTNDLIEKLTYYPLLYQGSIIIPINNDIALHIHHWIIYTIILLVNIYLVFIKDHWRFNKHNVYLSKITSDVHISNKIFLLSYFIIGFCMGSIFQGLFEYTDKFTLIVKNPYKLFS